MPFNNMDSRHFSATEKNAVLAALTALETALAGKLANLSPEERQQYGSVNEQNKLIINKVKDYRDMQPGMSSPEVNWTEFMNDYDSRNFIQNIQQRMQVTFEGLIAAKMLHDWDNFHASLMDYNYSKYRMNSDAHGYEGKVNELKQFFQGGTPPEIAPKNEE
ncbi:MAG: hypothetical protein M0D53_03535 [Flavobacterium sp. JAD_PAG50586_2]|nr:MAG: hypothetical protein M0D53_03535 [Flavobacterium sp. JAD_PAG50586_2]